MGTRIFDNSPVEPVHRATIALYEDLLSIYRTIRENGQLAIDKAFDQASREVGYLVTTTVPYTFVIGDSGTLEKFEIGSEHLQDTVFERMLNEALEPLNEQRFEVRTGGSYSLRLLWLEALKLRLKTHWLEPAHFRREWMEPAHFRREWMEPAHFRREWMEPAHVPGKTAEAGLRSHPVGVLEPVHWFDPGFAIASEEKVLISVLDEVYPELSLAQRIVDARAHEVARWPGTREPAHYRPLAGYDYELARWPGTREPAHYRQPAGYDYELARWPGTREPAHYRPVAGYDYELARWPGTREPAHYRQPAGYDYELARWPGIREPAHYRPVAGYDYELARWPGIREPAHYRVEPRFDYRFERWPGTREPAHYRPVAGPDYEVERWPGTREPAHRRVAPGLEQAEAAGVLRELAAVLRKHGV